MKPHNVIFIGPQGSGKGTQVRALSDHLRSAGGGVATLETGARFREFATQSNATASRVDALLKRGELAPTFLADALVVNFFVEELTEDMHLLCDGFPRNLTQAHFFDELLNFYNREALTVVVLDTPDAVVRERMAKRQRVDDKPELIDRRLMLYKERTEPVLEHYRNRPQTKLLVLDGSQPIEVVGQKIIAEITV